MAVSRADVSVPKQTWVNLYALSGVAVGTSVIVQNKGNQSCYLAISLAAPANPQMGVILSPIDYANNTTVVTAGEVGLWAYCDDTTKLIVQE